MTTCLRKSLHSGFCKWLSIVCASIPFGFEGGMWDLIVPDRCLSICFAINLYVLQQENFSYH